MTPRPRRTSRSAAAAAEAGAAARRADLAAFGLSVGSAVRFRRRASERWKDGTVMRVEADGSIGVCDVKGAMRSLPFAAVEVRDRGPRGGVVWVPLDEWAARTEQLRLL
ncbi:MAG: hypothetical protein FGM58_06090 [Acidimicrobiia bacterium]|nr:hypothetical protein [Acidimicrobiia bacterium]